MTRRVTVAVSYWSEADGDPGMETLSLTMAERAEVVRQKAESLVPDHADIEYVDVTHHE